jgi:hypothetical protein
MIAFCILDGLYFLALFVIVNPYISFCNYVYELIMTALALLFPIIYYHLPVNQLWNSLFPGLAVGMGVLIGLICLIVDRVVKPKFGDESRTPRPCKCDHPCTCCCGLCSCCCCGCAPDYSETVKGTNSDFMSIDAFGEVSPPTGEIDRQKFCKLISRMIKAMSDLCTESEVTGLMCVLFVILMTNLSATCWYVGAAYGRHQERLSVNC